MSTHALGLVVAYVPSFDQENELITLRQATEELGLELRELTRREVLHYSKGRKLRKRITLLIGSAGASDLPAGRMKKFGEVIIAPLTVAKWQHDGNREGPRMASRTRWVAAEGELLTVTSIHRAERAIGHHEILVHGFLDHPMSWYEMIEDRLKEEPDLVVHVPALLGHGGASSPLALSFEKVAVTLAASLHAIRVEGGDIRQLFTHSLGGPLAWRALEVLIARNHPLRMGSLVSVAPPINAKEIPWLIRIAVQDAKLTRGFFLRKSIPLGTFLLLVATAGWPSSIGRNWRPGVYRQALRLAREPGRIESVVRVLDVAMDELEGLTGDRSPLLILGRLRRSGTIEAPLLVPCSRDKYVDSSVLTAASDRAGVPLAKLTLWRHAPHLTKDVFGVASRAAAFAGNTRKHPKVQPDRIVAVVEELNKARHRKKFSTIYSPPRLGEELVFAELLDGLPEDPNIAEAIRLVLAGAIVSEDPRQGFLAADMAGSMKIAALARVLQEQWELMRQRYHALSPTKRQVALNYLWAFSSMESTQYETLSKFLLEANDASTEEWILHVGLQFPSDLWSPLLDEYLSSRAELPLGNIRCSLQLLSKLDMLDMTDANRIIKKHRVVFSHHETLDELRHLSWRTVGADLIDSLVRESGPAAGGGSGDRTGNLKFD